MKVLVTGAFGNIGCMVMEELLRKGHQVTAFDLKNPTNERVRRKYRYRVETAWGDIRDKSSIVPHVIDKDAVVHFAAIIPPLTETEPEFARKINVDGTRNVLDAIMETKGNPVLVYASSFAVFGHNQDMPPPKTVDSPLVATDNYSRGKIDCEEMIREHPKPWVILRLGACFDNRNRHTEKKTIRMMMDTRANNRMEYVHPADVATAAVNAIERPEAHNKVHLIGGGKTCQITQMEMLNTLIGAAGFTFREKDFGNNPFYSDWLDTSESQRILEFQNHSFSELRDDMRRSLRFVRPIVKPVSPLVRTSFLRWVRS